MSLFTTNSWLPIQKPIRLLAIVFIFWKTVLVLVVLSSPGPGYDTSTALLDLEDTTTRDCSVLCPTATSLEPAILKFVRWDAIYFTHIVRRGHVFEQEWAFGLGFSTPVSLLSSVMSPWISINAPVLEIGVAVVLSHVTHFLAVLLLFALSQRVLQSRARSATATSLLAAILHIVSPAGAFLSAPCAESLFAALNFLGFYLYIDGRTKGVKYGNLKTVVAGLSLGCATMVRSNGILGGLPLLYDAVLQVLVLFKRGIRLRELRTLLSLVIGGCLIATGAILPQYVAYNEYCRGVVQDERRSWCNNIFPSIYGWVQAHYWNVGIFRYWTVSNLPLFLLAVPCLLVLVFSSLWPLSYSKHKTSTANSENLVAFDRGNLFRLAMPQLVLALAAFTIYHVQIINRISSGYPLWYIWLASMIIDRDGQGPNRQVKGRPKAKFIVSLMTIYAVFQGGLFASFLPPA